MQAPKVLVQPTQADRAAKGIEARLTTPVDRHRGWTPAADRFDPVALLQEQNSTRESDLVPVRHGRMAVSPFTFYRGAAKIMAADLAGTPTAGLTVQLCGDAHLSNFGAYASPERRLVFDLNDFDETLPGPFEYDVKRLVASLVIAGRNNGFTSDQCAAAATTAANRYRTAMAEFSRMGLMELWYTHLSEDDIDSIYRHLAQVAADADPAQLRTFRTETKEKSRSKGKSKDKGKSKNKDGRKAVETATAKELARMARRTRKAVDKAHTRDSTQALSKLGERVDDRYRIRSQPPIVVPLRDFGGNETLTDDTIEQLMTRQFRSYLDTLDADRRHLLEHFSYLDMARKVVGVGSVGTRAFIVLLQGSNSTDPLFLQVKEATRSVLEDHLPASECPTPGERVVRGQRLMQAASDIFLGWTTAEEGERFYYWRQLRDMKGSADVETMGPAALAIYGGLCGWTLARAHARSGDPVAIAAYLGDDDTFETAVTDFAVRYADQNELDYRAFTGAIDSGRLPALRVR